MSLNFCAFSRFFIHLQANSGALLSAVQQAEAIWRESRVSFEKSAEIEFIREAEHIADLRNGKIFVKQKLFGGIAPLFCYVIGNALSRVL